MRTKLDIKIKWNKILRDEINKKLKYKKILKEKQIIIKRMRAKIDKNTK
jgi:hypothetical protein